MSDAVEYMIKTWDASFVFRPDQDISKKFNEMIAAGWEPHGSISTTIDQYGKIYYTQVFVRSTTFSATTTVHDSTENLSGRPGVQEEDIAGKIERLRKQQQEGWKNTKALFDSITDLEAGSRDVE